MMTTSPLTNATIAHNGRYNPRNQKIQGVILHHNAGINSWGEQKNPAREVSANYWIASDGRIISGVPEEFRAWTTGGPNPSGAQADHRSITFEISNSSVGGNWPISSASRSSTVKLIGDIFHRYGLGQVTRDKVRVHSDFQATACPGPYVMSELGKIIAEAEAYRKSLSGGSTVKPFPGNAAQYLNKQITIDSWWNYKSAADAEALRNPVRVMTPGQYTVTKLSGKTPHLVKTNGKESGWVHSSVLTNRKINGGTTGSATGVYTVVRGDTLYSISKKYKTTVDSIQKKNGLTGTLIKPGQKLKV